MAETMSEYYARKAREEGQMIDAIHENAMKKRRAWMESSPGSYSQGERQAVDNYFQEREQQRRFDESQKTARGQWGYTDVLGHHAGGAEKVAEYDWMGKRDAGSTAAGLTAEATKHTADKNFEGIEKQAQSALEIEKERQKYLDIINARDNATKIRQSEIEWGIHKPDGTYRPGGRVAQAQAQGEAAAKIAEQNNQARIEQERIKAQAKVAAQQMMGTDKIKAEVAGNPILGRMMQNQITEWLSQGMTQEQIEKQLDEWKQGGKKGGLSEVEKFNIRAGESVDTGEVNARSQKIRNTYQQRGIGV